MKNNINNNKFLFSENNYSMVQLTHAFAQGSVWVEEGLEKQIATFDLFVREMPANRNYLLFGGLEEILNWLQKIKFSQEDIIFLLRGKLINKKFATYLKNFKFSGTILAMPEGTIFFQGEPVVRITAPIIEASLIEMFLIQALTSNTLFLSKAARLITAANKKITISAGMTRAHSFESGLRAAYNGYLCGIVSTATPLISQKYKIKNIKFMINGQHFFISSFPSEIESFRTLAKYFPDNCSFMIDTYDFYSGLNNAITVGQELKNKGKTLASICIDSGDVITLSKYARKKLDLAGLKYTKILIAGNIDEYKLEKIVKHKTPSDIAVTVTEFVTCADSPKLETVYKVAEVRIGNKIKYSAKLAPGKQSYPGRKQVFRVIKNGKIISDTIGEETENIFGQKLLKKVMINGKIIKTQPKIKQIQKYIVKQLNQLPKNLLNINKSFYFSVKISEKLNQLLNQVKNDNLKKI